MLAKMARSFEIQPLNQKMVKRGRLFPFGNNKVSFKFYDSLKIPKKNRKNEGKNHPLKWTRIADELYEKSSSQLLRLGKHCRERWNNHLNPNLNKF